VLARNENAKRASWWAIFGGKERLEGSPICDQKWSDLVLLVLNRTSQINSNEFSFSHALVAREKHISYFLLIQFHYVSTAINSIPFLLSPLPKVGNNGQVAESPYAPP
jgi:hypothetical protein